ncbi:MAG: phosphoglycerate kinase [candidate division SR1 bacterium]|nr:phosphoglycerate kinase [candidate division SR1 bacterium]
MNLININNSIVFVRVCYDLPNLESSDRILDSKATIRQLLNQGNQVILLSHWGRPDGKKISELSLEKLLESVQSNFSEPVEFINQYDYFEKNISLQDIMKITRTKLFLFENTRFSPYETSKNLLNRDSLAQKYREIAQYFVDEAFPVSHRQEVTNYELKKHLPYAYGLSFMNELQKLEIIRTNPSKPFAIIMAGSKLETKLPLIAKMCEKGDKVLLGGELCFTFLKAVNSPLQIYDSLIEEAFISKAKELLSKYPTKIILPVDFIYGNIDNKKLALDLGPKTLRLFELELEKANSIFWNGPLGYYLDKKYALGTLEIGKYISDLSQAYKVLGGGDSVAVLPQETLEKFDFVSMGGGATLEYLSN